MINSVDNQATNPTTTSHSGLDPESSEISKIKLGISKFRAVILLVTAYLLFYSSSKLGFDLGDKFGYYVMYENFGQPRDLYPFLFATVMVLTGYLFSVFAIIITFIFMHQIGRRLKIAVGKPTFYGFLLYLLTVLRVIILDNLNKGR